MSQQYKNDTLAVSFLFATRPFANCENGEAELIPSPVITSLCTLTHGIHDAADVQ